MVVTEFFIYFPICYGTWVESMIHFILSLTTFVSQKWSSLGHSSSFVSVIINNMTTLLWFGIQQRFGSQHSFIPRPTFKEWFTCFIDPCTERPTYILANSAVITEMCHQWVPFGSVIWKVEFEIGVCLIYAEAVFAGGFLCITTLMPNHFELFGLRLTFYLIQSESVSATRLYTSGL